MKRSMIRSVPGQRRSALALLRIHYTAFQLIDRDAYRVQRCWGYKLHSIVSQYCRTLGIGMLIIGAGCSTADVQDYPTAQDAMRDSEESIRSMIQCEWGRE